MSTLDNPHDPASTTDASPWPVGSRYGLIAGLALIVIGMIIHLAGIVDYTNQNSSGNWISNIVNLAVLIGAMAMAIKYHRDQQLGGYVSFGRAFYVGFIVTLIITIVSAIWMYIFFAFVEPGLVSDMMEMTREQMIEEQGMSEDQVEQAMQYTAWFMNPVGMAISGGLFTLFFGVVLSLIVAAVMQKKPAGA